MKERKEKIMMPFPGPQNPPQKVWSQMHTPACTHLHAHTPACMHTVTAVLIPIPQMEILVLNITILKNFTHLLHCWFIYNGDDVIDTSPYALSSATDCVRLCLMPQLPKSLLLDHHFNIIKLDSDILRTKKKIPVIYYHT